MKKTKNQKSYFAAQNLDGISKKQRYLPFLHISAYFGLAPAALRAVLKYALLRPSFANMHPGTLVGPFQLFDQDKFSSAAAFIHSSSVLILRSGHFPPSPSLINKDGTRNRKDLQGVFLID